MGDMRSFEVLVREMADAVAALAAVDPTVVTEGELMDATVGVHAIDAALDAVRTRLVGQMDVRKAWAGDGARSAAAWVGWRCRLPRPVATGTLKCARALREMPVVEAAFLEGAITADHVRLLAAARSWAPKAFERDEARLVAKAREMLFRSFEKVVRYWRDRNAPDEAEALGYDSYAARKAHCSDGLEGTKLLDATFDPIGGAVFDRELSRLEQELFEADWAEARERLGDTATAQDLGRTPPQRRLDAMVEMARRSAAMPADARPARVLLSVLVGEESLTRMCELSDGRVITPGQLLPVLHLADVERIVFDGPSRVIDVGVRQRLFGGATRRAVEVRDRECTHPSCDVPAERCEIDHLEPYEVGGPTIQANGDCKCRFHHRWRHRRTPPAA